MKPNLQTISVCALVATVFFLGVALPISQNATLDELTRLQIGFTLFHRLAGAFITLFGISSLLFSLAPTLPAVPFGRSLVITMIGLSVFSISGWFAIAASIVFTTDCLLPHLLSPPRSSE